jgi:hypothetical protein
MFGLADAGIYQRRLGAVEEPSVVARSRERARIRGEQEEWRGHGQQ